MYNCKKCNCSNMFVEEKGNQMGLYCQECAGWQKWLGKDELREFKRQEKQVKPFENTKLTNIKRDNKPKVNQTEEDIVTFKIPLSTLKDLIGCLVEKDEVAIEILKQFVNNK